VRRQSIDRATDRAHAPRRITRAKQTIRDHGTTITMPTDCDRDLRLRAVLHVLYLIFNEGYASTTEHNGAKPEQCLDVGHGR
jgi:predicted RNA polymerase sigma factor